VKLDLHYLEESKLSYITSLKVHLVLYAKYSKKYNNLNLH